MFAPVVALGLMFFVIGRLAARSTRPAITRALGLGGVVLLVPAALYSGYYAHLLDRCGWFFALRAAPGSELLAPPAGLLMGALTTWIGRIGFVRQSSVVRHIPAPLAACALVAVLAVPYLKPLISPLQTRYANQWSDGICIQTTPSTCGPSSAATLLHSFGINASEQELGDECHTCGSGTENWYLARALRRRGVSVKFLITRPQPSSIPTPCICGTQLGLGGAGHFIAMLARDGDRYVVGDPIGGRRLLTIDQMKGRYYLTGFFMVVRRDEEGSLIADP